MSRRRFAPSLLAMAFAVSLMAHVGAFAGLRLLPSPSGNASLKADAPRQPVGHGVDVSLVRLPAPLVETGEDGAARMAALSLDGRALKTRPSESVGEPLPQEVDGSADSASLVKREKKRRHAAVAAGRKKEKTREDGVPRQESTAAKASGEGVAQTDERASEPLAVDRVQDPGREKGLAPDSSDGNALDSQEEIPPVAEEVADAEGRPGDGSAGETAFSQPPGSRCPSGACGEDGASGRVGERGSPTMGAGGTGGGVASGLGPSVSGLISRMLQDSADGCYPRQARRRGVEGTAMVRFCVDPDGHPEGFELVRSAGSPLLDGAARCVVEGAGAFPADASGKCVTVPIRFALRK